jgi:hypothetical protein
MLTAFRIAMLVGAAACGFGVAKSCISTMRMLIHPRPVKEQERAMWRWTLQFRLFTIPILLFCGWSFLSAALNGPTSADPDAPYEQPQFGPKGMTDY